MLMTMGLNVGAFQFRNHYALVTGSDMAPVVDQLLKAGLMEKLPVKGPLFKLSDEGVRIGTDWKEDRLQAFLLLDGGTMLGSDLEPVDSLPLAWRYRRSEAHALVERAAAEGRSLDIVHQIQMEPAR